MPEEQGQVALEGTVIPQREGTDHLSCLGSGVPSNRGAFCWSQLPGPRSGARPLWQQMAEVGEEETGRRQDAKIVF